MVHEYNMKIEAKTENEATEKMKAVTVLVSTFDIFELSPIGAFVRIQYRGLLCGNVRISFSPI